MDSLKYIAVAMILVAGVCAQNITSTPVTATIDVTSTSAAAASTAADTSSAGSAGSTAPAASPTAQLINSSPGPSTSATNTNAPSLNPNGQPSTSSGGGATSSASSISNAAPSATAVKTEQVTTSTASNQMINCVKCSGKDCVANSNSSARCQTSVGDSCWIASNNTHHEAGCLPIVNANDTCSAAENDGYHCSSAKMNGVELCQCCCKGSNCIEKAKLVNVDSCAAARSSGLKPMAAFSSTLVLVVSAYMCKWLI